TLKQKIVPLLKALKQYQQMGQQWKAEKAALTQQLQSLEAKHEQLQEALSVGADREQQLVDQLQAKTAETLTLQATLDALQTAQSALEQTAQALSDEKQTLQTQLSTLETQQADLAPLTALLEGDAATALSEAEVQMALVEETLAEMATNPTPDLSPAEQDLLRDFEAGRLPLAEGEDPQPMASVTPLPVSNNGSALPYSA
ncbi:MAG: hypothetical protein AAFU71_11445, partial [Cyanobacteria bacterium J06632_22]